MANTNPIFVGLGRNAGIKVTAAATDVDGAGATLLFAGDATNGSRIHGITAMPTGTLSAAVVMRIFLKNGATFYILGEKAIPSYTVAATVPAPMASFLAFADMPFLDPAEKFLVLGPAQEIHVALLTVPTNAVHVIAHGGDY